MSDPDKPSGSSGSIDVQLSNPGIPEAAPAGESQRVTSGRVEAAVATEQTGKTGPTRSQRIPRCGPPAV